MLVDKLIRWAENRKPDKIIGPPDDPYLVRHRIIPHNRFFNICLHNIRHSDIDRAQHSHPSWNVSILLRSSYLEHIGDKIYRRTPGNIVFRTHKTWHRIELEPEAGPVWSIFIMGPTLHVWQFLCPQGPRNWYDFVDARNHGQVGKGCD